ncbi:MAG TPA: HAMP domain-containing sensor histidine kinase [Terriglobales bacterium]|nr:HAMP domain-containing sensor histidine kinase [Terriglobales bacterium]
MPRVSIQRRLIATVVISQLLLAIGLVGGSVYLNHRLLRRAFDNGLRERAMSVAALVRYSEETPPRLIFEADMVPPPLERDHPDMYQVTTLPGAVVANSPDWARASAFDDAGKNGYGDFNIAGVAYRGLRLQVPIFDREPDVHTNDILVVRYASPLDQVNREVLMAGVYTGIGTAILLLLGVAFAIWGMRRGLQPLAQLANGAALVSPSHWELKPGPEVLNTTELAPLTDAMRRMLDGLERAFNQQRDFVANAAHELKTPVAILKSTLQLLLQRPRTVEQYRAGLEQALADMDRLEKLLHAMLRLARAEQGSAANRELEVIDLADSCQNALDILAPLARERSIGVEITRDGATVACADAEDLRLVWGNLLENAIRYTPVGGVVRVRISSDGERARVEIADDGPGISAADLPHIFERFYRGDSSRTRETGGYGLGLAISKALIEAYGGKISAHSAPQHGTTIVVVLPLAQQPAEPALTLNASAANSAAVPERRS